MGARAGAGAAVLERLAGGASSSGGRATIRAAGSARRRYLPLALAPQLPASACLPLGDGRAHGDAVVLDDPLIFLTEHGTQRPHRATLGVDELALVGRAFPAGNQIAWLRERSVIGDGDPGEGAAYRWLAPAAAMCRQATPAPDRLVGAAALNALADEVADDAVRAPMLAQADDLWQALRQRELAARVAGIDPELFGAGRGAARHWAAAVLGWRELPVLLRYAKVQADAGNSRAGPQLADVLRSLATREGRYLAGPP